MKSEDTKVEVAAWRVSAPSDCGWLLSVGDEHYYFEAVKPGDVVLLLDELGDTAWGARRVFLVRRELGRSIVYFDRALDFPHGVEIPFAGSGDKRALRKIDLDSFNEVLACAHPPHPADPAHPDDDDCEGWSYDALCQCTPTDNPDARAYVRQLLETIVTDDLLGPAQGPEEEIVGMSVRDRYILGRLGPRRVDGFVVAAPTDEEIQEADESPDENKNGNEDHAEHDESKTPATDIAEEEPEEDVADSFDMTRSSSLVPSSMGLTFTIDADLPDIEVTVSWGSYYRTKSEEAVNPDTGKPLNCWKRVPFGGTRVIKLAEGAIEEYGPDDRIGTVSVIGNVTRPIGDSRLVTLFLVNKQMEPKENRDAAWLFQPEIIVRSPDGKAIFKKRPLQNLSKDDPELKALDLIYRKKVEFAVGHNTSIHATASAENYEQAIEIKTTFIPHYEVPTTEVPGDDIGDRPALRDIKSNHKLNMRAIAADIVSATPSEIDAGVLGQLVGDYALWIDEQKAKASTHEFDFFRKEADENLKKCDEILERLKSGVKVLKTNASARKAFAFANNVMADQRVHSIYSLARRRQRPASLEGIESDVSSHEWRPFQLAFLLLSIPSLVDPAHVDRTSPLEAYADLLWFPTGGGKTEAYLGVAAFTMAIRRLQGNLGGLDASRGLSVIMRYTLRLLTVQQFQRASTLLCAMESERQSHPEIWGEEPFTLGLWVGHQTAPNTFEDSKKAIRDARNGSNFGGTSPAQLSTCPWCGAPIDPQRDIIADDKARTTTLYCSDPHCIFSETQERGGIPVKVVDDEMYHRPPTMMIATADKFAQMAWRGSVRTLFGHVEKECPRHGLVYPDDKDCNGTHTKPATHAKAIAPIRPPDLIIQDEFHLISGPLGTMVGLYETAVDELCSWKLDENTVVHPKIVASTATVRMADEQIRRVFYRRCSVFPPSGIDVEDNFFSVQRPIKERSGRDYIGICALGMSRPAALIRTYVAFLTAGQTLLNSFGRLADPYMTAVGYFNSLRELGGMRRLSEDDVQTRSYRVAMDSRVARPGLTQRRVTMIDELTSRVSSRDIPQKLAQLEIEFKQKWEKGDARAIDIVLATNMLSVGVDVDRLGLMIANGQPKNTAEYIQATSRVGRKFPGIVCTVFAWSRPRDFSHYEMFEHYHATFYKQVEAQSVTPFAPRALDRGLTGAMVSEMRLDSLELAPNTGASALKTSADARATHVRDVFVKRAKNVMQSNESGDEMSEEIKARIDHWVSEATQAGRTLGYERKSRQGEVVPLLKRPGIVAWDKTTVPTSMREVESSVRLIMDKRKLSPGELKCAPWEHQKSESGNGENEGEG